MESALPHEITEAEVRRLNVTDMKELELDLWARNALLAWQGVGTGAAPKIELFFSQCRTQISLSTVVYMAEERYMSEETHTERVKLYGPMLQVCTRRLNGQHATTLERLRNARRTAEHDSLKHITCCHPVCTRCAPDTATWCAPDAHQMRTRCAPDDLMDSTQPHWRR